MEQWFAGSSFGLSAGRSAAHQNVEVRWTESQGWRERMCPSQAMRVYSASCRTQAKPWAGQALSLFLTRNESWKLIKPTDMVKSRGARLCALLSGLSVHDFCSATRSIRELGHKVHSEPLIQDQATALSTQT